jgi:hypothetical protein
MRGSAPVLEWSARSVVGSSAFPSAWMSMVCPPTIPRLPAAALISAMICRRRAAGTPVEVGSVNTWKA